MDKRAPNYTCEEEELLGIVIADINKDRGLKAAQELKNTFGDNKAIYVHVDISHRNEFNAFEKYLPKYKSGEEGVIVNISSLAGIFPVSYAPVYSATKHGMIGLGRSLGTTTHYTRTKVRVLTICPGYTCTPILSCKNYTLWGPQYEKIFEDDLKSKKMQPVKTVSSGIIKAIEEEQECEQQQEIIVQYNYNKRELVNPSKDEVPKAYVTNGIVLQPTVAVYGEEYVQPLQMMIEHNYCKGEEECEQLQIMVEHDYCKNSEILIHNDILYLRFPLGHITSHVKMMLSHLPDKLEI
ncbi:hypothetical protein FQA39_LY03948 [Lamprigera yunnana]|nr:hypothetical protein FQA39_LY03948 [Lamprigera yunnana]